MAEIKQTQRAARILHLAMEYCQKDRNEFITREHLLLAMMRDEAFVNTLAHYCRPDKLADSLFRKMSVAAPLRGVPPREIRRQGHRPDR